MASISGRARVSDANPISGHLGPESDQFHPKYACGPLARVHPLTNSKCVDGGHASVIRRRTKSWNLRESRNRNLRDLHLEAIQREKTSRKPSSMPGLSLRLPSAESSLQKLKKRNRSSVLFFGKADYVADSPSSASPSDQLPPLFKLDNSSFLDLFQGETHSSPSSSVPKCQRASTMPRLSIRPVDSSVGDANNLRVSTVSPMTPKNLPWSPDSAYTNVLRSYTQTTSHPPVAARSLSASSRSSDPRDTGQYFSSAESQSSQSSFEDGNPLPIQRTKRGTNQKSGAKSNELISDLEVVRMSDLEVVQTSSLEVAQASAKRGYLGRRAFSQVLGRDKPLPSEPLVDIASPFFEIACPAVRAAPRRHLPGSGPSKTDNLRPRRSSSSSKKGRPSSPKLSKLSRGEKLGLALTLHAQGVKIPTIVRHELPTHLPDVEPLSPESGNNSPISKLIAELENFSRPAEVSTSNAGSGLSKSPARVSRRNVIQSTAITAHSAGHLGNQSAEMIILNILSFLDIHDLLSAARVSKGFYGAFKRHELSLTKSAIFNTCPAAWEYLEEPGKGSSVPAIYLERYRNGMEIITRLRTTLLIQCDTLLRQETISGLIRADKDVSKNIDQTFWRINTFCEVFGHKSSRRDSTQAQVEWLRSDRPSQMQASMLPGTKKTRPLSSAELLDLNEIWTCLASLLQGFHHQTSEAREVGLFERCHIDSDHTEEFFIRQWTAHVMTFGLSAIVELSSSSFEDARSSGWTRWSPAERESTFLTEAVNSVYQQRLIEEAELQAAKLALPRRASGRTRSPRKRHTAHGDVLRIQTQNLPRKPVGSPARQSSIPKPHQTWSSHPSHHESCSQVVEGPHSASAARVPQRAARRRSAASPAITASMFQALSLQPGASTQIGPTLFPSVPSSPRCISNPAPLRPDTPLSSIQSTPIALTQPERVPPRVPSSAVFLEQPSLPPPAPPKEVVSPVVDPVAKATNLLVNDMGFPLDAVMGALASCHAGRELDLNTAIAMLVSDSSKPAASPSVTPTVRLVHNTQRDSLPIQTARHSQPQPPIPPQDTKRSLRKKQDKSAYSAQTKLADFVGGSKSRGSKHAQKRQSKLKAYQVLGVTQDRRVSTFVS
jgi:hypothetical protein